MKRPLFIPLIVLVLVTMACSFGRTKPTAAPAEPTKPAAVQAEQATEPAAPVEAPTDTSTAPTVELATETAAPTETTAGPVVYTDKFDRANTNWSDPFIVTSQAAGHDPYVKVTAGDGALRFKIGDKETYVYKFLTKGPEGATTIEADFQNKGNIANGIALVCKANADMTSWYEARVSASNNYYNFYLYDKKLKTDQGKNPYVLLGKGHMKVEEYFPTKVNHLIFTCSDTELTLDINKGKKQASQTLESTIDGNMFGVAVLSADVLPGNVDFETVTVR